LSDPVRTRGERTVGFRSGRTRDHGERTDAQLPSGECHRDPDGPGRSWRPLPSGPPRLTRATSGAPFSRECWLSSYHWPTGRVLAPVISRRFSFEPREPPPSWGFRHHRFGWQGVTFRLDSPSIQVHANALGPFPHALQDRLQREDFRCQTGILDTQLNRRIEGSIGWGKSRVCHGVILDVVNKPPAPSYCRLGRY